MRYRTRTNGVSERLDDEPLGFWVFPAQRLRLTRYVRRVRELRQNVSSAFFLTLVVDPSVFVLTRSFTRRRLFSVFHRYGRFSKSIRPDEVGPYPLLDYRNWCLPGARIVRS
jgi:hypothetical protein